MSSPGRSTTNKNSSKRMENSNTSTVHVTEAGNVDSSSLFENPELKIKINLINREIDRYLQTDTGEPAILYQAAHHLLYGGGKRIRSLVTLLCCEAVSGDVERVIPITLAAELLQTASLIHDDIIDDDECRRGVQTVHRKFGKNLAILAGDLLISQAIRICAELKLTDLLAHMGRGGIRMCEGEAADLIIRYDDPKVFSKERYLKMIEGKTVAFFREAARIGALIGGASEEQMAALSCYGEFLGYAFQLRDDILDVTATQETTQKTIKSDLRLKRGNYPLIYALSVCSLKERLLCHQSLENGNTQVAINIISKTSAIEQTQQLAQFFIQQAKATLQGHSFQNEELLKIVADLAIKRPY